jgi:hypothetical protein
MTLHYAIGFPHTTLAPVGMLVDAGADTNFVPRLFFTSSDKPEAFSGLKAERTPLLSMFARTGFVKDDPDTLEKASLLLQAGYCKLQGVETI